MEKTIYFIRHGQTDLNRRKIVQGSGIDSDLDEHGWLQAQAFYDFYKNHPFDLVITSALKRTLQTVKPFLQKNLPHEAWPEINEINWGIHEGKAAEAWMIQNYNKMIAQWSSGNFDASLQNGESAKELAGRVGRFIEHIKTRSERSILVCTHGRTLRCLMCLMKDQHLREMENYNHSNTGLFKVYWDMERFIVELENDTRHLNLTENE